MLKIIEKLRYKLLPSVIDNWLRDTSFNYNFKKTQLKHKNALTNVQKKEKITVAFFLIHESVWKYEELYNLMVKDSCEVIAFVFKILILIC